MENLYDVDVTTMNSYDRLKLCGYMMEVEHNFSGNGCWPDSETISEDDPLQHAEDIRAVIMDDEQLEQSWEREGQ